MGFYVGLSSNGTLVDAPMADRIAASATTMSASLSTASAPRTTASAASSGAFDAALGALRLLRDRGIKVGVRFTMTEDNAAELPALLDLVEREGFHKFYLSHLVYAGRGNMNRGDDAMRQTTRDAMDR